MATMNHTNLTTYNVPALTEFFCSVFGFQLIEKRADKLSVLRNAEGFVLTLMYDKRMTPEQGYPGVFHVAFFSLRSTLWTLRTMTWAFETIWRRNRRSSSGGPPTYGFCYDAPGWRNGGSQHDEHCRTRLTASPSG